MKKLLIVILLMGMLACNSVRVIEGTVASVSSDIKSGTDVISFDDGRILTIDNKVPVPMNHKYCILKYEYDSHANRFTLISGTVDGVAFTVQ